MPLPPARRKETVPDPHQAGVEDFRARALIFSALTVAGVGFWIAFRERLPFKVAFPLIGMAGLEAAKNLRRWWEWAQAHPGQRKLHPDRVRQIEQETVKVLSDAARARAWFTRAVIACIAIPSALQLVVGIEASVVRAAVDPVAIREGEWWRLVTGTYLHGSLSHFLGNMSALLIYGSILEFKGAASRLPMVYIGSALAGSLASVAVPPDVPSVGASGGVVGLIGYLFVLSRRQDVKFPAAFRGATATALVGLFVSGALGFWYIDNPGHAGGVLMGMVLAAIVVDPARSYHGDPQEPLLDLLGWLSFAAVIAGAWLTITALLQG